MKHLNKHFHLQSSFIRLRSPFTSKWCDAHSISWSPWNYNFCVFMGFFFNISEKKMPSFEFWIVIFIFEQDEMRKETTDKRHENWNVSDMFTNKNFVVAYKQIKMRFLFFLFCFYIVILFINVQLMTLMLTCDINKTAHRQPTTDNGLTFQKWSQTLHFTTQHNTTHTTN